MSLFPSPDLPEPIRVGILAMVSDLHPLHLISGITERRSGDPPFPWVRMPPVRYIAWLSTNWWSGLADSKP